MNVYFSLSRRSRGGMGSVSRSLIRGGLGLVLCMPSSSLYTMPPLTPDSPVPWSTASAISYMVSSPSPSTETSKPERTISLGRNVAW